LARGIDCIRIDILADLARDIRLAWQRENLGRERRVIACGDKLPKRLAE
jgi:hypothetical protein